MQFHQVHIFRAETRLLVEFRSQSSRNRVIEFRSEFAASYDRACNPNRFAGELSDLGLGAENRGGTPVTDG